MLFGKQRELHRQLSTLRPRLYRVAYSWTHAGDIADDLVQEALARALKNLHQLKEPAGLDKWVFTILTNCWRNYLRDRREMDNIEDVILQEFHTPESLHEQHYLTHCVKQAIASLSQEQRQVVTLVDLEDFSYGEVAEILDIPIGTVMSRLCRARKALCQLLMEKQPQWSESTYKLRRIK